MDGPTIPKREQLFIDTLMCSLHIIQTLAMQQRIKGIPIRNAFF